MFNWKDSSLEDCAWHIARVSAQQTSSVITYYTKRCDKDTLTKIIEARKLAKRYRVLVKEQIMEQELLQEGLSSATNLVIPNKRVG